MRGADFTRTTTGGLVRGTEAFQPLARHGSRDGPAQRTCSSRAKRILSALTDVAAEAGDTLFDAMGQFRALADGGGDSNRPSRGLLLQVIHGLVGAFELLPAGMQSTVAMAVAVGAAVLISGRPHRCA